MVSVHAPLSSRKRAGCSATEAFTAAKPGLIVVNTARGPIIDVVGAGSRDAQRGPWSGAGLDVLPNEPAISTIR